jgi:hypothetical protein
MSAGIQDVGRASVAGDRPSRTSDQAGGRVSLVRGEEQQQ